MYQRLKSRLDNFSWDDLLVTAVFILFLCVYTFSYFYETQRWDEFSAAHACKKVGVMQGQSSIGVSAGISGSQVVAVPVATYLPDKVGWLCSDGTTYWR